MIPYVANAQQILGANPLDAAIDDHVYFSERLLWLRLRLLHQFGSALPSEITPATIEMGMVEIHAWLKQKFTRVIQVDDLAARAHMSRSTFRRHFRTITGTSPLQYQKQLRLQEARQVDVESKC